MKVHQPFVILLVEEETLVVLAILGMDPKRSQSSKKAWVEKLKITNNQGPKKIWVPKASKFSLVGIKGGEN